MLTIISVSSAGSTVKTVLCPTRENVRTVSCPKCNAPPGQNCTGARDNVRKSNHMERIEAFLNSY